MLQTATPKAELSVEARIERFRTNARQLQAAAGANDEEKIGGGFRLQRGELVVRGGVEFEGTAILELRGLACSLFD